jgi:hypothetical protein
MRLFKWSADRSSLARLPSPKPDTWSRRMLDSSSPAFALMCGVLAPLTRSLIFGAMIQPSAHGREGQHSYPLCCRAAHNWKNWGSVRPPYDIAAEACLCKHGATPVAKTSNLGFPQLSCSALRAPLAPTFGLRGKQNDINASIALATCRKAINRPQERYS